MTLTSTSDSSVAGMRRFVALGACIFAITSGEFVVAGVLPQIAGDTGVTEGRAGLVVTAYAAGMVLGGPLVSALTAHVERRRCLLALMLVATLGNLASAAAPSLTLLLACRAATASVTSTFFARAVVTVVSEAEPGRAGAATARLAVAMNLGLVLGSPLGAFAGHQLGWRATFVGVGLGCLVGLALVAAAVAPAAVDAPARTIVRELAVLRSEAVAVVLLLTTVANIGVVLLFTFAAPLSRSAGLDAWALPWLLVLYGVAATGGSAIGGIWADRSPDKFLATCLAALAAIGGVGGLVAESWSAVVVLVVSGAMGFAIVPGLQVRTVQAASTAPTLAVALNASGYQAAAAVAGLFGGALLDSPAPVSTVYLASAVPALVALAILAASVRRTRGPRPTSPRAGDSG